MNFVQTQQAFMPHMQPTLIPRVDVLETDDDVIYVFELPGADPDNIELEISRGELYLSAPLQEHDYKGKAQFLYRERQPGRYFRVLIPPPNADGDAAVADYKNGLLEIHFPKINRKKVRKQASSPTSQEGSSPSSRRAK